MMGDSGGRSSGNRKAPGAPRRATPRERAGIDSPLDQLVPVRDPRRNNVGPILTALAWGSWVFFCVLFALVLFRWLGLML